MSIRRGASCKAVADARVRLLARKYGAGPWTDVDEARLRALTARLDVLVPQVTDADRARLAEISRDAARAMTEVEVLLRQLDV